MITVKIDDNDRTITMKTDGNDRMITQKIEDTDRDGSLSWELSVISLFWCNKTYKI